MAKPQPINDLVYIGVKSAALVAAGFVDFPKNKCNFLHKNKLYIVRLVQFLTGRRPMRSFSPGAVATVAPWKSAPMHSRARAHAATSRYLPLATELQQTRCTSLLLPVDGTDRRGRTDTRQLHRRLPHMRAAAILQCAVISEIICRFLRQLCPLHKPTCGYR